MPKRPRNSAQVLGSALNPRERKIIAEELAILDSLRTHLNDRPAPLHESHYDEALIELRDSLGEARTDELAQIVNQMSTLASLSGHTQQRQAERPIDKDSPYFGHMRVRQEGRERDILIGSRTLISGGLPYPIIDWRHAPISRVFYSYKEGDEYEEEIGGREVEGEVLAHRRLMIVGGHLVRIDCPQGVYHRTGEQWEKIQTARPSLTGGAGTAPRPASALGGRLGVGSALTEGDKHLRAITGLIDAEQFEIIARPESGIVVVDGGAGSGKTTIALHRMAYLAYRDPERFAPERMMAVVYSRALAIYISQLLPALGVSDVRIEVFEEFMSALRQQHYPSLAADYVSLTPTAVMRFKQHPLTLNYLQDYVRFRLGELRSGLERALGGAEGVETVLAAWDALAEEPATQRLELFTRWAGGKHRITGIDAVPEHWLTLQRLTRHLEDSWPDITHPHVLPLAWWEEAFLSLERLTETMERLAPGEFSTGQLTEVRDWALRFYGEVEEYRAWQAERQESRGEPKEREEREEGEEPGDTSDTLGQTPRPRLDREDDTLLLLLYSYMVGPLRSRKRRPLRVSHLMVDEAQDLGPLELRVLISMAAEPQSITLAGDTDQRMILHNAFNRWEEVLDHLGLPSTSIRPLRLGYRCTSEIMDFSRHVLGPLATERPWVAIRSGAPVEMLRFTDAGQAVSVLAEALRGLMRRESSASVALISRYPAQADLYHLGLVKAEVPSLRRVADQDFAFRPGIEVTDVQQVKGLEFDYVILLDVDRGTYPDDAASRYLLHIAATRAAHQLWLVSCREPSPLLPETLALRLL